MPDSKPTAITILTLAAAAALVLGLGSRPADAFRTTTTSTSGACYCQNCGSAACDCLFRLDGSKSCNINCVLCEPAVSGVAGGGAVQLAGREATFALNATTER